MNAPDDPRPELTLVIPTYNESENLPVLLEEVRRALAGISHEVLVVDDNSPDGTWRLAAQLAERYPALRVVRRMSDKGLSPAVVDGFKSARGRFLGVMDADLSHDPRLLPKLLAAAQNGADVAIGSRRVPGGGADHWPWYRRLSSNGATLLARALVRLTLKDPMSGYFIMRRSVFDAMAGSLKPKGYKILLEIMVRGHVKNYVEIPFVFKDRQQGYSKVSGRVLRDFLNQLWDLRRQM